MHQNNASLQQKKNTNIHVHIKNEESLRLSSIKEILANFKCIADQILCCE